MFASIGFVVDCSLLQRGSMFVFSQSQFQHLLGVDADWTADSLLDLGSLIVSVCNVISKHCTAAGVDCCRAVVLTYTMICALNSSLMLMSLPVGAVV